MSDNQKIRRRLRCPNCGSLDVIKWGIRNGIQRHKAGIANDRQMVLWTFAVSGALWRSSRGVL